MGQWREVHNATVDHSLGTTTVTVERPLDSFVSVGQSFIALNVRSGLKAIVGNTFLWTGVVQFYGTTLGGVQADNDFDNVNVVHTISPLEIGGGMQGVGKCYGGAAPLLFTEWTGNTFTSSDGIWLHDLSLIHI